MGNLTHLIEGGAIELDFHEMRQNLIEMACGRPDMGVDRFPVTSLMRNGAAADGPRSSAQQHSCKSRRTDLGSGG